MRHIRTKVYLKDPLQNLILQWVFLFYCCAEVSHFFTKILLTFSKISEYRPWPQVKKQPLLRSILPTQIQSCPIALSIITTSSEHLRGPFYIDTLRVAHWPQVSIVFRKQKIALVQCLQINGKTKTNLFLGFTSKFLTQH